MSEAYEYHDIYDRIAKRCLSLSTRCTVFLINGLFGTDYPPDSDVDYHWTENTDDRLKKTLADTIVTINHSNSYHIEFQMTKDGDIFLRVLEYGFHHATRTADSQDTICFPEPLIVYLYDDESFPDEYILKISFGKQGSFLYKVPVFKYLKHSLEELDCKKLIMLLPFQLLKLRRTIEQKRTKENIEALKNLITHDILNSLNRNVEVGNITPTEALKLSRMILYLYRHIYEQYDELKKEGVNQMTEDALIFDVDILEYEIEKLEKKNKHLESEKQNLECEKQNLECEKQSLEDEQQKLILLLSQTYPPEEIAARTGIASDKILEALRECSATT